MADTRKKVVIRGLDDTLTWGYVPASGFVRDSVVELLDPAGKVLSLPLSKIKTIAYVKDFNLDDSVDPERLGRRSFLGRPRMEGLWLKLEFVDRETLEGLSYFDLGLMDGLMKDGGITVSPPDARSNTQRLFIPRAALLSVQVLGFITAPSRAKPSKPTGRSEPGGLLFDL